MLCLFLVGEIPSEDNIQVFLDKPARVPGRTVAVLYDPIEKIDWQLSEMFGYSEDSPKPIFFVLLIYMVSLSVGRLFNKPFKLSVDKLPTGEELLKYSSKDKEEYLEVMGRVFGFDPVLVEQRLLS